MRSFLRSIYLTLRWIPLALCRPLFGRRKELRGNPGRLLVIRWDRIGDMVLSTPVFEALKQRFPNAVLDILASSTNGPVVRDHPAVDNVLVWTGAPRSIWSLRSLAAVMRLRRTGYDLVVDLYMDWPISSALLSALIAPLRIGLSEAGKSAFYTLRGPEADRSRHLVENNASLLQALGISSTGIIPRLGLPGKAPPFSLSTIGIHPGGHYSSQRWPEERWLDLAMRLKEVEGVEEIILLLDQSEHSNLEAQWRRQLPGNPVVCPSDTHELMLAISELDVLLCNNSGPLHLAGALGVPTLSTMGPTNPDMWWPVGERQVVVQSADRSVENISVEQMIKGWQELRSACSD